MARLIDADALIETVENHVTTVSCCPTVDWSMGKTQMKKQVIEDIRSAPTSVGWIAVTDRLPDKAGIYIICDHYGNVMSRHFCKQHGRFAGYWHFNGSAKYGNPRYWMPLPEAPEEGDHG